MPRKGTKATKARKPNPQLLTGNGDAADGPNPYREVPTTLDKLAVATNVLTVAGNTVKAVAQVGFKSIDAQYNLSGAALTTNRRAAVADLVGRSGVAKADVKKAAFRALELSNQGGALDAAGLETFKLSKELLPDVQRVAGLYRDSVAHARKVDDFHNSTAYWAVVNGFGSGHRHRHVKGRRARGDDDADYSDDDVMFGL